MKSPQRQCRIILDRDLLKTMFHPELFQRFEGIERAPAGGAFDHGLRGGNADPVGVGRGGVRPAHHPEFTVAGPGEAETFTQLRGDPRRLRRIGQPERIEVDKTVGETLHFDCFRATWET